MAAHAFGLHPCRSGKGGRSVGDAPDKRTKQAPHSPKKGKIKLTKAFFFLRLAAHMPRTCVKTGKRTAFGNTRSHSNRHTRRTWKANIQVKKVLDPATGEFKRMKVSAAYLRTLSKRMSAGKKA